MSDARSNTADLIVVGGGTVGLAAAYHGARRGLDTLMVDQFPAPGDGGPNDYGSSRGLERMFRILYAQTKRVRLVETAYAMWHELQAQVSSDPANRILLEQDLLFFGNPDVTTFEGNINEIQQAMDQLGIPIDRLSSPDEIAGRYPIFDPAALVAPDGNAYVGLVQNNGATINVARAFEVTRGLASRTGRYRERTDRVVGLEQQPNGHWKLMLSDGATLTCQYLVLCPGMWLKPLLAPLGLAPYSDGETAWSIWQMTLAFFDPAPLGKGAHWPIWYEFGNTDDDPNRLFYGFPDVGLTPDTVGKFKISADYTNTTFSSPEQVVRTPDERIIRDIQAHLSKLLRPGVLDLANPTLSQTCMYSMAPDGDMVIGGIPVAPQATELRKNAAMFCMASGRGFKYTPLFGRILVDQAIDGETAYDGDLSDFSPSRPSVFQAPQERSK